MSGFNRNPWNSLYGNYLVSVYCFLQMLSLKKVKSKMKQLTQRNEVCRDFYWFGATWMSLNSGGGKKKLE